METYLIGIGSGTPMDLTIRAKELIESSDLILAGERIIRDLQLENSKVKSATISEMLEAVATQEKGTKLAILASGDIGFFSIAKMIKKKFPDNEIHLIPGLNSLQILCSKIGVSYENIKTISLHGRKGSLTPLVTYYPEIFVLTEGGEQVLEILQELINDGLEEVQIVVGENLSSLDERISIGTPKELLGTKYSKLTVLLIRNRYVIDRFKQIEDEEFLRGKVPMTKAAIRSLAISTLEIAPTDRVVDIGSGTGSVTIELAKKACENWVYGIEKNLEGLELLKKNKKKFKVFNIREIYGEAPQCLKELPPFDKAFIGGSAGNLEEIIESLRKQNPKIKIVITAVTLETLTQSNEVIKKMNLFAQISQVNISHSVSLGSYQMLKPENPVFIIKIIGGK